MQLGRREFLKIGTTTAIVTAAGVPVPEGWAQEGLKWAKAPCRFCGVGCGVLVGVRQGRVEAV